MISLRPGFRQRYKFGSQFNTFNPRSIATRIIKDSIDEIEAPEFDKEHVVELIDEGDVLRLTVDLVTELLKEGKVKARDGTYKNGVLEINLHKN